MSEMVRKQIYITRRQEALLKRLARLRGLSEAEIIRRAIDREAEQTRPFNTLFDHSAWEAILKLVEERKNLGIQGKPYQWNRQEIYQDRENRWIHDRSDEHE
jgi:hypothetical protein